MSKLLSKRYLFPALLSLSLILTTAVPSPANAVEIDQLPDETLETWSDTPLVPSDVNNETTGTFSETTGDSLRALRAAPIYCRISQDNPHPSSTTPRTINTHLTGDCPVIPTVHSIEGSSYRNEWWGWAHQRSSRGSAPKKFLRITTPFLCNPGSYHQYRTTGRYYTAFANGYTGVSYRTKTAFAPCNG
ncbi:hypothetical protein [Mycetocola spongiae]|uniref:hypothetical protein n=1 Tax=Mycetocola spongiae TaxID=2859226 RepID=UPI001CF3B88B|nr:hypothetical protein [Mycetocola spongiae]UCR89344.1 hypothetical protein KXZ72_01145 [Mycetocola spongiae]